MKTSFTYDEIAISRIAVPDGFGREERDAVQDDILRRSIRDTGVQQPLILLPDGDGFRCIKGTRRLAIAKELGLPRVPAVIGKVPDGKTLDGYSRDLRLMLDLHRQDLMPSQKAEFIQALKTTLKLSNPQVATYLGVDADSITNWLAVLNYESVVVKAMDAGQLTMKTARVFDGMSKTGQERVWKLHREELTARKGTADIHKEIRAKYPPTKFRQFYRDPDAIAKRLERGSSKTRRKKNEPSAGEKRKLLGSFEMLETEIEESKAEAADLKREITEATIEVAKVKRNRALWALVPADMKPELERFCDVYVA